MCSSSLVEIFEQTDGRVQKDFAGIVHFGFRMTLMYLSIRGVDIVKHA